MKKWLASSTALVGVLAACASKPHAPTLPAQGAAQMLSADVHDGLAARQQIDSDKTSDEKVVHVIMYELTMPYGTVTRSAPFWKLIDETAVEVSKYDLLLKNGIRVGRGQIESWPQLRKMLDQGSTSWQISEFHGLSDQDVQLDMVPKVDEQTLFVFNDDGTMPGRTYGESRNRFSFRFNWARGKTDTIRAQICPVVVTPRSRYDYSTSNDPAETDFTATDHIYDLGLKADMGPGEFLVIAPSIESSDPTRVGHCFLTVDGPSDRYEKVLILVSKSLMPDKSPGATTQPTMVKTPERTPDAMKR